MCVSVYLSKQDLVFMVSDVELLLSPSMLSKPVSLKLVKVHVLKLQITKDTDKSVPLCIQYIHCIYIVTLQKHVWILRHCFLLLVLSRRIHCDLVHFKKSDAYTSKHL